MVHPILIQQHSKDSLTGQFLVATPQIQDEMFRRSVIYMCGHNQEGAMGVIINRPLEQVDINEVIDQLQIDARAGDRHMPVLFGGPVENYRGYVMHNGNYLQDTATSSKEGITVTANIAVLKGWLEGDFTAKASLALGYAGWSSGQLEREIEMGSWVVVPANETLMFDTPVETVWEMAVASLGFDMGNLSATVGHA